LDLLCTAAAVVLATNLINCSEEKKSPLGGEKMSAKNNIFCLGPGLFFCSLLFFIFFGSPLQIQNTRAVAAQLVVAVAGDWRQRQLSIAASWCYCMLQNILLAPYMLSRAAAKLGAWGSGLALRTLFSFGVRFHFHFHFHFGWRGVALLLRVCGASCGMQVQG
jgi:hypothetical protein